MAKRKRSYNPNLIRGRSSYTVKEIAEKYNVHPRTVQDWIKEGMGIIKGSSKPFLLMGDSIKEFLRKKNKQHKCKLGDSEFYCTKCRSNRKSTLNSISVDISNRKLGNGSSQVIIKGNCEECNNRMIRFSSANKLIETNVFLPFVAQHNNLLTANDNCSVNTDIEKGERIDECEFRK